MKIEIKHIFISLKLNCLLKNSNGAKLARFCLLKRIFLHCYLNAGMTEHG